MALASIVERGSGWSSNKQYVHANGSSNPSDASTLEVVASKWRKTGISVVSGAGSAVGVGSLGDFTHGSSYASVAKSLSGTVDLPVANQTNNSVLDNNKFGVSYTQGTPWRSSSLSLVLENGRGIQKSMGEAHKKSPRDIWRGKNEMSMKAGSLRTALTSTKGERSSDRLHEAWEYKIGTIISAPHHDRAYQTKYDSLDKDMTETAYGPVNSKYRKFIVVAKFKQHVIGLPIFTHNGIGLQNKQEMKEEFVSVRESAHKRTAAPAESKHGILWHSVAPELETQKWYSMKDTCSVKVTAPCIHNLRQKCTISGKLDAESTAKLLLLFRNALGVS